MQGAKQMTRRDVCSPGNRAGWAVRVYIFCLGSCFGLVWSSRAEEVRREMGVVMPESRSTRLLSEAQDPETQLQFVHSGGRDFCTAFKKCRAPTMDFFKRGIW
jgi:hypothetical protein